MLEWLGSSLHCKLSSLQGLLLAVKALYELRGRSASRANSACLIIAGGYDKRLAENRDHYEEVQQLVIDLGLEQQVCGISLPAFVPDKTA